jgi:hypothetical protein
MTPPNTPRKDEVREIAAKLTKAQRASLHTLREPDGRGKWPARHALVGKGLFEYHPWRPTAIGLEIRAYLKESGND